MSTIASSEHPSGFGRADQPFPSNVDAEEAVLGSILIDPDAIIQLATFLEPADFYREQNRWIYEVCLTLHDRNESIDQISVAHELQRRGRFEEAGGFAHLSHLVALVPTSVHALGYAQIVQHTAFMRRLIEAGGEIARIGYESGRATDGLDSDKALARAEEVLFRLRQRRSLADFVHIREVLDRYFEESAVEPSEGAEALERVPSGFIDLDRLLGGLHRSDLIVVAARPSLGKSSFALNVAHHASVQHDARVGIFSLEMSKEQLVQRLLAAESGVDSQKLRLDLLNAIERQRIMEAMGILADAAIFINDAPIVRISEMMSKSRRLKQERGLDLLIVDYLQMVQGSGVSPDNRVQEIGQISRSLKALARELNVPVLALSQLSRAVEQRSPHIPLLSDLRESGSIEQDADIVLFIYRDDVYYTEQEWERHHPGVPFPRGIATIIVAKHRHGPTGQINLQFMERITRFNNLAVEREA